MSTVIEVDDVWKKYRLGIIGTGTLRHDFERWWHRVRGKPDPYSKVDQRSEIRNRKSELATNVDHRISGVSASLGDDEVWALRGVSFEVKQGEILGIIGRNGAGKSTLLKILSRVTAPTSGEVRVKGRIASLLEVGTGFHPELTGRENVFLNGAIMGMTKSEIRKKFDEIVDFAGVERYIDTPVKRYSSGMYVRLAFAVAAHLDPEILIVDEVLAVGDAQFQKKCIGKMGEASKEGGTVLFVSHNLTVLASLCDRAVLLDGGVKRTEGAPEEVIITYVDSGSELLSEVRWDSTDQKANSGKLRLLAARIICDGRMTADVKIDRPTTVQYDFEVLKDGLNVATSIHLLDKHGACVLVSGASSQILQRGCYQHSCVFPANLLNDNSYSISIYLLIDVTRHEVAVPGAISFMVHETTERGEYLGQVIGCVRPRLEWKETFLNGTAAP